MPRRLLHMLLGASLTLAGAALADSAKQADSTAAAAEELKQLQEDLAKSKQNLARQHERLQVVRETPVNTPTQGPARVAIVYRNEMTTLFKPVKYEVNVDGFTIFTKNEAITTDGQKDVELYRGSLATGQHQLTVTITMKGAGYGGFAYLKDYKFVAHAGHVFNTTEDKLTKVDIVSSEKQGAAPKDRPMIQFEDSKWNVNVPSIRAQ
jgi:hypothetical protein